MISKIKITLSDERVNEFIDFKNSLTKCTIFTNSDILSNERIIYLFALEDTNFLLSKLDDLGIKAKKCICTLNYINK